MIKTIRYCDICGREQQKNFDRFFQLVLPERDYMGDINLSEDKKDICKECLNKLYWEISELKHPNRKCFD